MEEEDKKVEQEAIEFAKKNKKLIARKLTDTKKFPPDDSPVSVFMAGSPGAGKTESSQKLVEKFSKEHSILRIDPDEIRNEFATYNGKNSSLFQGATSIVADKMHDLALENKQSFVFDSTLTNLDRSRENISRSLKRNRLVQILYVYQDPIQAWNFVRAREKKDGRNIPRESFIRQYYEARKCVNLLKNEFQDKIKVDILVKNIDGSDLSYYEGIIDIDKLIPEKYIKEILDKIVIE